MLLALISLIAGALTVLAPCVLPLLPIIIGGAAAGDSHDRLRPYLITSSLALSVIGFTLLLKASTIFAGVSQQALDIVSGTILIALGLAGLDPNLWDHVAGFLRLQSISDRWLRGASHSRGRLLSPILIGVALGPVFASCSPTYAFILASVLPKNLLTGTLYLAIYSLGLVAALLAIALAGRRLTARLGWAVNPSGLFRRAMGLVFILVGLAVLLGAQASIEVWVANHLPLDEARLEQVLLRAGVAPSTIQTTIGSALNADTPAPEFAGLTNWINSSPLTVASLRGKVVLVDFWTYSCINCIRTLPYVEKWYQTYQSDGLVVIGVNTPEFAFEHDPANVAAAVKKFGITYPVALDNNYDTWNAYNNDSWPADYLIDRSGTIRYTAFGEGDYPHHRACKHPTAARRPYRPHRHQFKRAHLGLPNPRNLLRHLPGGLLRGQPFKWHKYVSHSSKSPGWRVGLSRQMEYRPNSNHKRRLRCQADHGSHRQGRVRSCRYHGR